MDILNEVNKITTDLYLPATDEESTRQILENNKWGSILNKRTFKTLSDNDKSIKQILINIVNEVNDFKTKKDSILLDIENAKTDIEKLEGLININEQKTVITTGTDNSTYNIKGTDNHLKYNGKDLARVDELPVLPDLSKYIKNDTPNTLTQKLTGTDIESNKLITNELLLNGVNVNLSNYITNDNVVKQIEKVIGLVYGGNIQDIGNKTTGKFYFDIINNYFYECISNNSLTYVDNSKFRPISNKPISDKIKILETVESQRLQHPYGYITFTKVGNIVNVIILFYIDNNYMTFNENQQLIEIPLKFRPSVYNHGIEVPFSSYPSSSSVRLQINPTNISIWGVQSIKWKMLKTSVTYISN